MTTQAEQRKDVRDENYPSILIQFMSEGENGSVREDDWSPKPGPQHLPDAHIHTYEAEADFGLPECGAASHKTKNEHYHTDADDDGRQDQRVPVLDEAVKAVIAPDHIGADVGQRRSCSLQGGQNINM